jgi:fibrillarin-like rRNA methylase
VTVSLPIGIVALCELIFIGSAAGTASAEVATVVDDGKIGCISVSISNPIVVTSVSQVKLLPVGNPLGTSDDIVEHMPG